MNACSPFRVYCKKFPIFIKKIELQPPRETELISFKQKHPPLSSEHTLEHTIALLGENDRALQTHQNYIEHHIQLLNTQGISPAKKDLHNASTKLVMNSILCGLAVISVAVGISLSVLSGGILPALLIGGAALLLGIRSALRSKESLQQRREAQGRLEGHIHHKQDFEEIGQQAQDKIKDISLQLPNFLTHGQTFSQSQQPKVGRSLLPEELLPLSALIKNYFQQPEGLKALKEAIQDDEAQIKQIRDLQELSAHIYHIKKRLKAIKEIALSSAIQKQRSRSERDSSAQSSSPYLCIPGTSLLMSPYFLKAEKKARQAYEKQVQLQIERSYLNLLISRLEHQKENLS